MQATKAVLRAIRAPLYDTAQVIRVPPTYPHPAVAALYHFACFLHWSILPLRALARFLVRLHRRLWRGGLLFFGPSEHSLYRPWVTRPMPFAEPSIDDPCPECGKGTGWTHLH